MTFSSNKYITMIYILLVLWIVPVNGYYDCLCSYDVEKEVYPVPNTASKPFGYLYEFDCKELITKQNIPDGWWKITFEHQFGYISKGPDQHIEIMTCAGDPPPSDKITTIRHTTSTTTQRTTTTLVTILPPTVNTATPTIVTTPTSTITTSTRTTLWTTPTSAAPTTTAFTTTTPTTTTPTTTTPTTTTPSTTTPTTTTPTTTTPTTTTPTTTTPTTTTTTPTTTTPTTTTRPTTTTIPIIGDVYICPSILRQYAQEDGGALTQYGSYCYELVPTKAIWRRAAIDCKAKGGDLIHINHLGLQNHIYKWINKIVYNESVWIGLHDIVTEGHFDWVSGDPVLFTNFQPGRETASSTEDDCVEILAVAPYFGLWYNVPCGTETSLGDTGRQNPFICEYPIYQYHNPQPIGK